MKKIIEAIKNEGVIDQQEKAINTIAIDVLMEGKLGEDATNKIIEILKSCPTEHSTIGGGWRIMYSYEECIIFNSEEELDAELDDLKRLMESEVNCKVEVFGFIDNAYM